MGDISPSCMKQVAAFIIPLTSITQAVFTCHDQILENVTSHGEITNTTFWFKRCIAMSCKY
jgi:hypothetical protein